MSKFCDEDLNKLVSIHPSRVHLQIYGHYYDLYVQSVNLLFIYIFENLQK